MEVKTKDTSEHPKDMWLRGSEDQGDLNQICVCGATVAQR